MVNPDTCLEEIQKWVSFLYAEMEVIMGGRGNKFSKKVEKGDLSAMHDISRTTTTYDRARKRRMNNFDAWFNAGR